MKREDLFWESFQWLIEKYCDDFGELERHINSIYCNRFLSDQDLCLYLIKLQTTIESDMLILDEEDKITYQLTIASYHSYLYEYSIFEEIYEASGNLLKTGFIEESDYIQSKIH